LFGPIAQVGEEIDKGLHDLQAMNRAVDELVLLDNTTEGRRPWVIAQFVDGQVTKLARSVPAWTDRVFGKEFGK